MTVASHRVGIGRRFRAPEAPAPEQKKARPLLRFALAAAGSERSNDEIVAELAKVAEEHAPEGGYGETAWCAERGTVFWVCADWTGAEEHDAAEAAFRAVEGVREFEHESEAALPEGEGWERVWPLAETAAAVPPPEPPAAPERPVDALLSSAMQALVALAEKPAPAPSPITIQMPKQDLTVHVDTPAVPVTVEGATIIVPQQPPPTVQVDVAAAAPAPAPEVHVAVAPTPIQVDVAAPNVQVDVEVPRPGPIRVETEEDGTRVYIPEPAE